MMEFSLSLGIFAIHVPVLDEKAEKQIHTFFPFLFHAKDQSLKTPTPPPPQFSKQVVQLRPRT